MRAWMLRATWFGMLRIIWFGLLRTRCLAMLRSNYLALLHIIRNIVCLGMLTSPVAMAAIPGVLSARLAPQLPGIVNPAAVAVPTTMSFSPSEKLLQTLHFIAQKRHVFISDQEQYQRHDYWRASLTGDCEDYALWMQSKLVLLNIPSELIWVWRDDESHMVLLVADRFIIDNLETTILTVTAAQSRYRRVFGKWQLRNGQQHFTPQAYL